MQTPHPGTLQQLRTRRLTGTPEQVRNAVAGYHSTGQLAELTAPQPVPGRPGLVCVDVRLLGPLTEQPATTARPPRRRRRWPWVLVAVIAAVALLCWAVYALVTAVAAAVSAAAAGAGPLLLGALVIGALLLLAGGGKTCTTIVKVTHKH
jgi:hypothetical protein